MAAETLPKLPGLFQGEHTHPRLPQHSLGYNFYRKFYSTYNIFQQKGNIQEDWCTLLLQKQTEALGRWGRRVACSFYSHSKLDTQLALAPTERGTRRGPVKLRRVQVGQVHLHSPNRKQPPPRANCTGSIH